MVVGFTSLIPVLHYATQIPFHPAQSQTLKLICNCVSYFPGVVSPSHMEELVLFLARMFGRHTEGEIGMLPETFILACTTFAALLKTASSCGILKLVLSVEEASKHALLSCLSTFKRDSNQFLHSLYLLKEAYAYSLRKLSSSNPSNMELCDWLFPTEKTKLRTYLMLSSLVDVLLGQNIGKPIRDAALYLPSDPVDLLFLLGQQRSLDMGFSSCQLAALLMIDEKLVLSSLEQFILVNGSDFLHGIDSLMMMQLVNLFGFYRGVGMMNN
ncbi:putative recombination initiation defect protein [Tripterygium wilfordii]|uniref:Putative recombination initiation defect protein n=1 Tax=Tripterygium wilfordii TaxID=458696 RepID=A0A7J7BUE4_TRIWF|nr:putative recombination initiation defect protein [Tripterygium wilfordii]